MKTLAVVMATFVVLAMVTKEFTWKTRVLLIGVIVAMMFMLSR